MKIGILTFHRAINYGAFLQAFALKTFLESLDHEVAVVDYWPKGHAKAYKLWNDKWWNRCSFIGKLKYFLGFIIRYRRGKTRKVKVENLLYNYLNLQSEAKYQFPESLVELDCDCIIYGSDQIWWKSSIPGYEGFDPVYWGEYISNAVKKIAYAPSMGIIDLTDGDKKNISKWLCNFDKLSVRESQLYEAIHGLTEKEISVVLDPVFLLSKEGWERYCVPIDRPKYILYYNLLPSKEADDLVDIMKNEYQCDVVEITGSVDPLKIGKRYIQTADAIEFISLIKSAEFVVTSSFHGTAFSILFEKQFYVVGVGRHSGRIESLLSELDINNRLIRDVNMLLFNDVDYTALNKKIDSFMSFSKKYLTNILSKL